MYFSAPNFIRKLFPMLIWSFPSDGNSVYLTFDDGPTEDLTPWVLDKLDEFDAHATFFCLGKNVEQHPEIYKMIVERGHAVGNHSYSHLKGWGASVSSYIQDFDFAAGFIDSNLIRPPYGRLTPTQAKILNERYKLIMWDILSRDYSTAISRRGCVKNVIKHLYPGAIVVFHDSLKASRNLKYALPRVLEFIKTKGYVCRKIEL
ncbi:MAG: polysaccharide deacetylase family protein [Prevotellaceae bacterium]|jgi:peptidoglycan/xylan/chitin deacetylase (PgdA/CDA1 family)|nr:polysaccharide deacetylase family protein [Prevotellaceae bacterium]